MQEELAQAMREGMRQLASGVAVLACAEPAAESQGRVRAMTVSSITSVSDAPPSLLVCVHRETATAKTLMQTPYFSLSVLTQAQQTLADTCAFGPEEERAKLGEWARYGDQQIPYPCQSLATFFCRINSAPQHGTHYVVVADIEKVLMGDDTVEPLIYLRGAYRGLKGF